MDEPVTPGDKGQFIAESLRGGATGSIESELERLGWDMALEHNQEFLDAFDAEVFMCEICGWWCGRDEESQIEGHEETCDDHDDE